MTRIKPSSNYQFQIPTTPSHTYKKKNTSHHASRNSNENKTEKGSRKPKLHNPRKQPLARLQFNCSRARKVPFQPQTPSRNPSNLFSTPSKQPKRTPSSHP